MHIMIGHILCDWVELNWVHDAKMQIEIEVPMK
jgi:hypothetical protein